MKKYIPWLLAAAISLPVVSTAQTFTFSTNTSPGVVVSTNPFGTGVGVSTPYFNTIYTSDGYYDGYYYGHPKRHHHRHHKHYRSGKAHHKAMKKARKAYRKEMKKQYKKAYKHHRHHHHDDD